MATPVLHESIDGSIDASVGGSTEELPVDGTAAGTAVPCSPSTALGPVDSSERVNPEEEIRGPSLSPSRASDFKACPLRYRFRVIDRLPEPPSAEAARGTLIHAVLDALFDLPAGTRDLATAKRMLAPAWTELQDAEPELGVLFAATDGEADWLTSAERLLERYFALEDPNRIEPAGREEQVSVEVEGGLQLRGIIDRLDVAANGAIRVVDYKTGRAPSELWEAKALFQLKFYALVIWKVRGVVPTVLQLLYLADEQRLTYSPTESELVAFERQIQSLWRAIELAQRTGDFRASKGPLCRFCDHQERCPEFGGTPPPFPLTLGAS